MLDTIIRKTYGYHKKEDKISTSQFMELTGLSRFAVGKGRRKLKEMNLIAVSKKGHSQTLTYSLQKDYDKWKLSPKKDTVSKKGMGCIQKRYGVYPKKDTKCIPKGSTQYIIDTYTKYTYTKDSAFLQIFQEYLLMRKKIKKPATDKAQELVLKKLHNYDLKTAIAILEQSIVNSWQGVFPLKNPLPKKDEFVNA